LSIDCRDCTLNGAEYLKVGEPQDSPSVYSKGEESYDVIGATARTHSSANPVGLLAASSLSASHFLQVQIQGWLPQIFENELDLCCLRVEPPGHLTHENSLGTMELCRETFRLDLLDNPFFRELVAGQANVLSSFRL